MDIHLAIRIMRIEGPRTTESERIIFSPRL